MSVIEGRVWKFGDNIDTDLIAPGVYMKLPIAEAARHTLEAVDPAFARDVQPGDIVLGGSNFGLGSSREQAPQGFAVLGVGAVLAPSFARIFYRNALNLGLPALFFDGGARVEGGHRLRIEPLTGVVTNLTTGERFESEPIPAHLMAMIEDGGLMPHLKKALAQASAAPTSR